MSGQKDKLSLEEEKKKESGPEQDLLAVVEG